MAGIRVGSAVKRIEVNDAGDYIEINFDDQSFLTRLYDMLDRVDSRMKELAVEEQKIRDEHAGDEAGATRALVHFNEDSLRYLASEFDDVFGEGTCRKVFGDIVPSVLMFYDFMSQLQPYLEAGMKEQGRRVERYSAARMGNA